MDDKKPKGRIYGLFRFLMRAISYTLLAVLIIAVAGYILYSATLYKTTAAQKGYLALTRATISRLEGAFCFSPRS